MRICDFDGARRIGKPRDWNNQLDGDCLDIFVADAVDVMSGLPVMYSVFQLSAEEIDALKAGGCLRLGIVGAAAHPVFQLAVLGPKVTTVAGLRPAGELGGVIEAEE